MAVIEVSCSEVCLSRFLKTSTRGLTWYWEIRHGLDCARQERRLLQERPIGRDMSKSTATLLKLRSASLRRGAFQILTLTLTRTQTTTPIFPLFGAQPSGPSL